MVRSMGYQPVAEPRPRGPLWVTHAVDRDGQQVRVLIDGFSGRVIDVLRRPLPPHRVAVAPPPSFPPHANGPFSDYEDDGPDYDYRDMPQQRPHDWPPSRPNAQQQGPNVIPYEPRSDNQRLPNAPKTNTAKKKDAKKDSTAALAPPREKQKAPAPKMRPADAPKANDLKPDAPKADAPKADVPKSAQTPTFVLDNNKRGSDPKASGAVPPAQPLEMNRSEPTGSIPPVQPPF